LAAAIFAFSINKPVLIACFGALVILRFIRVLQVQFESNIQHLSNDQARATIASLASFSARIITASLMALVGLFAIDNSIVRPIQIALLSGVGIFVSLQLILRRRASN
jgi:hypothetical protein